MSEQSMTDEIIEEHSRLVESLGRNGWACGALSRVLLNRGDGPVRRS